MLLRIDKDSTLPDGSKTATAYHLSKSSGVSVNKVRVESQSISEDVNAEYQEQIPRDSDAVVSKLFASANDEIAVPVYNSVYIDKMTLDLLSAYSAGSKLCIFTSTGFYKSFDIGEKSGVVEINLMENESPEGDEYVTSNGFPVIKTDDDEYRPKFINFGSYVNPLVLSIKIVGNDKTSAAAVVKCIIKAC